MTAGLAMIQAATLAMAAAVARAACRVMTLSAAAAREPPRSQEHRLAPSALSEGPLQAVVGEVL